MNAGGREQVYLGLTQRWVLTLINKGGLAQPNTITAYRAAPPVDLKFDMIQDEALRMVAGQQWRGRSQKPEAQLTLPAVYQPKKRCQDQTIQLPQILSAVLPRTQPISLGHNLTVYQVWSSIAHVAFCREEISTCGKVSAVTLRPSSTMEIPNSFPSHLLAPVCLLENSMNYPSWTICPP